jgi:hypothetical protein
VNAIGITNVNLAISAKHWRPAISHTKFFKITMGHAQAMAYFLPHLSEPDWLAVNQS